MMGKTKRFLMTITNADNVIAEKFHSSLLAFEFGVDTLIELTPELELSRALETVKGEGYVVSKADQNSTVEIEEELDRLWGIWNNTNGEAEFDFKAILRQFVKDNIRPKKIELPIKKIGTIDLPKNVSIGYDRRIFVDGDPIDLNVFPQLNKYCKPESIRTEVDYSAIPVGTVVSFVVENNNCVAYFKGSKDGKLLLSRWKNCMGFDFMIVVSSIQSLEILSTEGV